MKRFLIVATGCVVSTLAFGFGPTFAATPARAVSTVCGGTPTQYVLSLGAAQMLSAQSMIEATNHAGAVRSMTLARSRGWSPGLSAWHQQVLTSGVAPARKDATVSVYDANGRRLEQILLKMAWPSKVASGAVTTGGTQQLQQTLTLSFENEKKTCG